MNWQQIFPALRQKSRVLLNGLLAPRCLICSCVVTEAGRFCADYLQKLAFLTIPHCPRCDIPYEIGGGTLDCLNCLAAPPRFTQARAAVVYDAASRPLVLGLKRADHTYLANTLARMMRQARQPMLADCDGIAPVPLHRRHLFLRCFNQSALLAQKIAKTLALPVWQDMLIRRRSTLPQTSLNANERARNVRDAFAVKPKLAQTMQ